MSGEGQKGPIHNTGRHATRKSRVYNCQLRYSRQWALHLCAGGSCLKATPPKELCEWVLLAVPKLGILKLLGGVAVVSFVSVVDVCRGNSSNVVYLTFLN